MHSSPSSNHLQRSLFVLAMTAGVGAANLFYSQSLLNAFRQSFPRDAEWVGVIPTATLIGFATGMLLFAPLGDRLDRRRLILLQMAGLCIALIIAATAFTLSVLIVAGFAIGLFATFAQQAAPFAAELAPPEERGRAVGAITSGLLLGILVARASGSFLGIIARDIGWQVIYLVGIILIFILAVLIIKYLPPGQPTSTLSYGKLLGSLWQLFVELRRLREAALTGAALFAAFVLFWSVLSLLLAHSFHLGPDTAGLFSLVGVTGAITAPWAGKFADWQGPRTAISVAIGLVALSYTIFIFSGRNLLGIVIGVIVLDIGLQVAQTPNQSRIFSLNPDARSRLNTVYMICYFIGGGVGSATAMEAWQRFGWHGVCLAGFLFAGIAAGSHLHGWRVKL